MRFYQILLNMTISVDVYSFGKNQSNFSLAYFDFVKCQMFFGSCLSVVVKYVWCYLVALIC